MNDDAADGEQDDDRGHQITPWLSARLTLLLCGLLQVLRLALLLRGHRNELVPALRRFAQRSSLNS